MTAERTQHSCSHSQSVWAWSHKDMKRKSCLHSILHNKRTRAAHGGRIISGPQNPLTGFFSLFRPTTLQAHEVSNMGWITFSLLLWSVIRQDKKTLFWWRRFERALCIHQVWRAHLPKTVANWCLSQLTVTSRQTGPPACIPAWRCVSAPCGRCRREPASGCPRGAARLPWGDATWCRAADVFPDMAAGPALRATTRHPKPST